MLKFLAGAALGGCVVAFGLWFWIAWTWMREH